MSPTALFLSLVVLALSLLGSWALKEGAEATESEWYPMETGFPPSSISGKPAKLTIHNRSGATVKLAWVKYNGTLKEYGELKAGEKKEQGTFSNASWMVSDVNGKALGYFRTVPGAQEGVIPQRRGPPALRTQKYSARAKGEAAKWQRALRKKLFALLKIDDLVAADQETPLNVKTVSTADKGSYFFYELEINSTTVSRIKVVLTVPKEVKSHRPAVVAIAGHSGTRHSCYQNNGYATQLAESGYVTVSTKISQHSLREDGRTMMGERLWDLMRCVDLLVSREEVDPKRIGCAGNSLGGEMAMWLGGMDQRIAATLSAGFLTRMDQIEVNHCRCWKFPGLRALADFSEVYALTAPRPLFCQNGKKEKPTWFIVSLAKEALEDIKPIYRDYGVPENLTFLAHEGGHVIEYPALHAFFRKHLRP